MARRSWFGTAPIAGWHFPKTIHRPRVAHFCGKKPLIFDRNAYSQPFTIPRLEHHRRQHGELGAWTKLLQEEWRMLVENFRTANQMK